MHTRQTFYPNYNPNSLMAVSFRGKYLSLVYMCEYVHVCVCRCVCMCMHASGSQKLTDSTGLAIRTAPGICLSLPTRAQYVDAGIWILILMLLWQARYWPKYLPSPSIPFLKTLFKSLINLWCTSGIWYLCQPWQTILPLLLRANKEMNLRSHTDRLQATRLFYP